MKKELIVIAVLLMVCYSGISQADPFEYTIMKTTEKIVIDGILDENDWEAAKPVGNFQFFPDYHGDKQQTEVKVLWDDIFLYIAFKVDDRDIWGNHYDTNSKTFQDDCVEMFWNPNPEAGHKIYIFEINCFGNMLSVFNSNHYKVIPPHVSQSIKGTVNNNEDTDSGWILEIAIRFEDYPEWAEPKAPTAGNYWEVGFNRLDRSSLDYENKNTNMLSSWCSIKGFYNIESFGKLIFSTAPVSQ